MMSSSFTNKISILQIETKIAFILYIFAYGLHKSQLLYAIVSSVMFAPLLYTTTVLLGILLTMLLMTIMLALLSYRKYMTNAFDIHIS